MTSALGVPILDPATFIGWMNPLPVINGRHPVISNGFVPGERFKPDGSLNYAVHLGADIMYGRIATDPTGPASDVAIPRHHTANLGYITWPGIGARAAGPGKIWDVETTKLGHSVQLDHGKVGGVGLNTFYQHLTGFARPWKRGDVVLPGTVLGEMGGDPANPPHLRHLHFEVWLPDGKPKGRWSVDPAPYLALWAQV